VAPNPFTHNFTVYAGEVGNHTVVVTDITGKVMFSKEVKNANSIQINEMSELSAGIYFVTLDDGTAIKVIKQ
jgi:surface antigen